jgi:serine/threonine protein kinase/Flp pilus assembly protein TadD
MATRTQDGPSLLGRILGHYRILERIGAGGMGVVYRARDQRLERDVALKLLPPGALGDASARKRFRKEALALSRLNHPNVATVHDFDSQEGTDFLVTELVRGLTLDDKLAAGPLPEKEVIQVGLQLADGLEAAHREGVIHRDLKPGNLRLTPEGRLKILDFGLAKRVDPADQTSMTQSLSEPGATAGTLAYMAPEQLKGEKVDARSDLWAAGVVLYELSTGRRPFEGRTANALADQIFHAAPPSPQTLQPALSPRLAEVILKCLEKDPDNRYQSAKELLVDFRRLGTATAVATASPAAALEPQRPWARVQRALSRPRSIAVAAVLLLFALLLWVVMFRRPSTSQPAEPSRVATATAPRVSTGGKASSIAEANEYFEKAMLFLFTQDDLPRSREMLERALALDPHFAEARAWYGFTDVLMVGSGYSNDSSWLYKAEQESRQALRDDADSGRAHSTLAAAYMLEGRKELVPGEAAKALAANPADLDARTWLSNYYVLNGDYATADSLSKQILDKQPLFYPAHMNLGDSLRQQGDTPGAVLQFKKILDVDAQNNFAITGLAQTYMDAGDLANARTTLERGRPQDRKRYETRLTWVLLLALEGRKDEAAKEIDPELTKYCQSFVWTTLPMAEFYAVVGDTSQALTWLERAVSNGDERVEWFRRDPLLANLRRLPRFQQILESTAYRRQQRPPFPPAP